MSAEVVARIKAILMAARAEYAAERVLADALGEALEEFVPDDSNAKCYDKAKAALAKWKAARA